jgi:hypothetical protein
MTWVARSLLFVSGLLASWFVDWDDLNFPVYQMVIATILAVLILVLLAFWPLRWPSRLLKK